MNTVGALISIRANFFFLSSAGLLFKLNNINYFRKLSGSLRSCPNLTDLCNVEGGSVMKFVLRSVQLGWFRCLTAITLLLSFSCQAEEIEAPRLASEVAPHGIVADCVNVITGSFFYREQEISIGGAEPLDWTRLFESGNKKPSEIGFGQGYNFSIQASYPDKEYGKPLFRVESRRGATTNFVGGEASQDGLKTSVYPRVYESGYCNLSFMEGGAHIKNCSLRYHGYGKKLRWGNYHLSHGSGLEQFYEAKHKRQAYLVREIRPNGNRVLFEYDSDNRPIRIRSTNRSESNTLAELKLQYNGAKVLIEGSNGQKVEYQRTLKKHSTGYASDSVKQWHITSTRSSHLPKTEYSLRKEALVSRVEIDQWSGRKVRYSVDICLPESVRKGGSAVDVSYYAGKVSELRKPWGLNGETIATHRFSYGAGHSEVLDPYRNLTRYKISDQGLIRAIQDFRGSKEFYRAISFAWDAEGQLLTRYLSDAVGRIHHCQTFTYDPRGNVRKERLVGNLSGEGSPWVKLNHSKYPILDKQESFAKTYTHSDNGLNLVLTEKEDFGPLITYRYREGTNLVIEKITSDDGAILEREYFQYDENACCTEHIRDSGELTPRQIQRTEYSPTGLSLSSSSFFSIDGEETLLKREEVTYTNGDLIDSRTIFGSNGEAQYTLTYKHDERRRLIEESDALGRVTYTQYDESNRPTFRSRSGSGFHTLFHYDVAGRIARSEEIHDDCEVRVNQVEYDLKGRKSCSIDNRGHTTRYDYDHLDRLIRITFPAQQVSNGAPIRTVEKRVYDIAGNLTELIARDGTSTRFAYNCRGQKTLTVYSDGSREIVAYNLNGTIAKKSERDGSWTWYGYDKLKRVVATETFAEDDLFLFGTKNSYDGFFLVSSVDRMGEVTAFDYDRFGRKVAERKAGHTTTFEYDVLGQLCRTTNGTISQVEELDVAGRLIEKRVEDAQGIVYAKTTFVYDDNDQITETYVWSSEEEFALTRNEYDSRGNLVRAVDAEGNESQIVYDETGKDDQGLKVRTITTIDPMGNELIETHSLFGYVTLKQRRNVSGELLEASCTSYDASGRELLQQQFTVHNGRSVGVYRLQWDRDRMGRITQLTEQPADELSKITKYVYDKKGRLTTTVKPDGVRLFREYDVVSRLSSLSSSDQSIDYTYTYDHNDNLLESLDHTDGSYTLRTYDPWSEVVKETLANGLATSYERGEEKSITGITFPDGSGIRYDYKGPYVEKIRRLSSSGSVRYEHHFKEVDWLGNSLEEKLVDDVGERATTWNSIGFSVEVGAPTLLFTLDTFDQAGHVLQESLNGKRETFSYNDRYQLHTESGSVDHSYEYDSLDNRRAMDNYLCEINTLNQLVEDGSYRYDYDENGNCVSAGTKRYEYDALDRLKRVFDGPLLLAEYDYDSFGRRIRKTTPKGVEHYHYHRNEEIGSVSYRGKELRLPGPTYSVAFELGDRVYVPLYDHRGSVLALLDAATGEQAATSRYSAFGEEQTSSSLSPWRYEGKRFDPETGFLFFGARYYEPSTGRWISPDPLGFADGPNLYAYVHNNPLAYVDPTGLMCAPLMFSFEHQIQPLSPMLSQPIFAAEPLRTSILSREVGMGHINSQIRINYANGIKNYLVDAKEVAKFISTTHGNATVLSNFDGTQGFATDVMEAIILLAGGTTQAVHNLVADWREQLAEMGPGGEIIQYCHSRGNLVFQRAIEQLTPSEAAQISLIGLAPPWETRSNKLKSIYQVSNDSDGVTFPGRFSKSNVLPYGVHCHLTSNERNHKIVKGGKGDFFAHGVLECSVYRSEIVASGRDFVDIYGRVE